MGPNPQSRWQTTPRGKRQSKEHVRFKNFKNHQNVILIRIKRHVPVISTIWHLLHDENNINNKSEERQISKQSRRILEKQYHPLKSHSCRSFVHHKSPFRNSRPKIFWAYCRNLNNQFLLLESNCN